MITSEERQTVLKMIADGKITPEEGAQLLAALRGEPLPSGELPPGDEMPPEQSAQADSASQASQPEPDQPEQAYVPEQDVIDPAPPIDVKLPDTRHWWQIPFWIGAALLLAGAFMMAGMLQSGAVCLLLLCAFPTLVVGLLLIIAAWLARNGPWVHIRVKHNPPGGRDMNFSVPLDLGVVAVRVAEPFVPQMRNTGVDDVIVSLKNNVQKDQPLIIDVNDDNDGEHVQVIVG